MFGGIQQSFPSRFLKEIPDELVEDVGGGIVIGGGRGVVPGGSPHPAVQAAAATSGAECLGLVPGDAVVHARFGQGVVIEVQGEGEDARRDDPFQGARRKALPAGAQPDRAAARWRAYRPVGRVRSWRRSPR